MAAPPCADYDHPALPTETEINMPPPPSPQAEVRRRSANYHPSIWGDHFLSYANNSHFSESDAKMEERHQELIQEVKMMVVASITDYSHQEQLGLVDEIQRLGISYHFEQEIDSVLQHVRDNYSEDEEDDLHTLALCFRLLRQQGHNVSSDVFKKKDDEGNFKESLTRDMQGMLSLYEAAHMRVHGEDILDEALEFTTTHLRSSVLHLNNPLATLVSDALKRPIRKALERVGARRYIPLYQQSTSHSELLSNFATIDFNILQKMHQRELCDLTRWWKDLNFKEKLPFARDRLVECYFWILGVYFEPQYCFARRVLTKTIALTSILDDIYDIYGTLEELVLFTDAIERWESSAIDELPGYMGFCYQALLDVYTEMEQVLASEGKSYRVPYAKAAMERQVKAYLDEAKWCNEGYTPTMEEYMKVALVTSAYSMLSTIALVGMKDEYVNKETFEWMASDPLIIMASNVINRLMDDMVGHEFEQERGHVASAIECYMKQHGTSKQETFAVFEKQVTNAWKDINGECFVGSNNVVPMPLLKRFLNLVRVIDTLYKDEDGYTHSSKHTKDLIASVLIHPVSL